VFILVPRLLIVEAAAGAVGRSARPVPDGSTDVKH
jgi:hypothetical protein